jgi:hypothetical protein
VRFDRTPFRLPLSATHDYLGFLELPLVPVVAISCQHSVRYEPNELPDCSTPHHDSNAGMVGRQTLVTR